MFLVPKIYSKLWISLNKIFDYTRESRDANWIFDRKDTKSTNGYVFTIGRGDVSWKSSKQTCITRSTMEFDKAEGYTMLAKTYPCYKLHYDNKSSIRMT